MPQTVVGKLFNAVRPTCLHSLQNGSGHSSTWLMLAGAFPLSRHVDLLASSRNYLTGFWSAGSPFNPDHRPAECLSMFFLLSPQPSLLRWQNHTIKGALIPELLFGAEPPPKPPDLQWNMMRVRISRYSIQLMTFGNIFVMHVD